MSSPPSISIIIPTLNSAGTLARCLDAIKDQDYPENQLELLICDGGSQDQTKEIALRYKNVRWFENSLKSGESGKAVGLKNAKNDLVAFIDSDNFIIGKDWLQHMASPFLESPEVISTEPLFFHYTADSSPITRYCALMGLNDPLCYYTGNFDRWNYAINDWTTLPIKTHDRGSWFWFESTKEQKLPTLGANGTFYRRSNLAELPPADFFFDVDIPHQLLQIKSRRFAKVRCEIFHWYSPSLKDFCRKQKRRICDFLYHQKMGDRTGHGQSYSTGGLFCFILSSWLIFPCLWTSLRGFFARKDLAWFLHWPLCFLTFWIYTFYFIKTTWISPSMDRSSWQLPPKT